MSARLAFATWALSLGLWVGAAAAQSPAATAGNNADRATTFRLTLKGSGLFSRQIDGADGWSEAGNATGFARARVEATKRGWKGMFVDAAYEQRVRAFSSASGLGMAGALPAESAVPFRVRPLDWELASTAHASWRHEIDRAAIHARPGGSEVTLGRQAIGWGRGVMFGAIDLFTPFSPLEVDREWRRGVDAVRAEVPITRRASAEFVAAFGPDLGSSAAAGRVRGYAGPADLEFVGGRRAEDAFAGLASSTAVAGAELHGEFALFWTPAVPGSFAFGSERTVPKAVAGASNRLPVGAGLLVEVEYHYSGFGAASADELTRWFLDPESQRRYVRGDFQILSRHAVAVVAAYEWSPLISTTAHWLQNPRDGSGLVMPSVVLTPGDRWSITATGYLAFGQSREGVRLSSEYGSIPDSVFLQVRFYR